MTEQAVALFNRRAHAAEVETILRDLFKDALRTPAAQHPRAFFDPQANELRKAIDGAAKSAAAGDWKAFMEAVEKLAASLGIANPEEVARRAAAVAQKA